MQVLNGANTRAVQAVTATVLFLVVTWLTVRQPVKTEKMKCKQMEGDVKEILKAGKVSQAVWVDDSTTQIYAKPNGPLSCGRDLKGSDVGDAQTALLRNIAEVKVLLDSLNATYWIDRGSLESILQKDDNGVATGYFHRSDTSLYIGLLHEDSNKVYKALLLNVNVTKINDEGGLEPATDLETLVRDVKIPQAVHRWNSSKAIAVLGRPSVTAALFMNVFDIQTGARITLSTYGTTPADGTLTTPPYFNPKAVLETSHTFPNSTLLPTAPCKLYEVYYPCPAQPSYYLDELAGGSWLFRSKASKVTWLVVIGLFLSLAHWVVKKV
eukprot:TRINITY_DN37289_c0_g1_i1.p1 TRINITY_DN37289_c0_g1~~TRINITY_DN37289_c0_g1_i1.p1  ORF type:complete len:325 (+),score=70.50 TRINITY_DN37289_c0_g1_i1:61-1035(+)